MSNEKESPQWSSLKQACAATLAVMNGRLAKEFAAPSLWLDMVDAPLARELGQMFNTHDPDRWVNWDWETLFHRRVKRDKAAWMFAVSVAGDYGAVCYGTIGVESDRVSIEYLERRLEVPFLKGIAARIAIQDAEALAAYLELSEVRVCDPDPALVSFYEQNFGLTRHSHNNEVTYLFKKAQP
jgi:hypothetical protein